MGYSIENKVETITKALQKIVRKSNSKPNKTWVEKDSEFYNR